MKNDEKMIKNLKKKSAIAYSFALKIIKVYKYYMKN